ncbi:protein RADIALIS-like 6 [Pyrus ussuriensis x Pyrus communis]|uniref:Protein RADIALIS-like 6 n=1 Tax=Pyrus ussuriensis x Pyrus communis TaxID=2448454 RepID=A0A5N5GFI8_9ROSA|nr:protein RADIALIS-like 6 [Pyrus ussuriensis x Pyrus communis]
MNCFVGSPLFSPFFFIKKSGSAADMDVNVFPTLVCGWTWEENKLFELALAVVDEEDPQRWDVVASLVGGKKSAEDVQKHYVILLEDLQVIESGKLDHKLGQQPQQNYVQVDHCTHSVCWTDETNNLLVQLDLN